jgi:hypothetical protein
MSVPFSSLVVVRLGQDHPRVIAQLLEDDPPKIRIGPVDRQDLVLCEGFTVLGPDTEDAHVGRLLGCYETALPVILEATGRKGEAANRGELILLEIGDC